MLRKRKSHLTASQGKRRRKASETRVESLDGLFDCLETIGALAGLLEATGRQAEPLEPGMIAHTGKLILAEVTKANEWLDKLDEATH